MESLSNPFIGLRVVAACYTGAYFPIIISLQLGVQSRHLFSITKFRVILFSLAFKVVVHGMAFRATISFQIWRLEPTFFFSLAFRVIISLQLGVQSHHLFSVTMFRVVILSLTFRVISSRFNFQSRHLLTAWHLEPQFLFNYGVQVTISLQLGVQSHHIFSFTTFRVFLLSLTFKVISSQFGIQSHDS